MGGARSRGPARNMPPVISTIVMLRFFARRQRTSMSAYFTNRLTLPTGLDLLAVGLCGGIFPVGQRVARSLSERWPALRSRGVSWRLRLKAINSRTRGGAARSLAFNRERKWTKQDAALLCSPRCRFAAEASLGQRLAEELRSKD